MRSERLAPVPQNLKAGLTPKPDDWSNLRPIAADEPSSTVVPRAAAVNGAARSDDDPANGVPSRTWARAA
jgi:type IV secretion system protein VirD4